MNWLTVAVIIVLAALLPTAYAGKIGAPYVPARRATVRQAFEHIGLNEDDLLIELGAGDGSVLIEAAQRGARATGYELSPFLWIVARLRTLFNKKIKLIFGNFYKASLTDATVIYLFLMPANMPRVHQLLTRQSLPRLKYVVSYAFALGDLQPEFVVREKQKLPLYIYSAQDIMKP